MGVKVMGVFVEFVEVLFFFVIEGKILKIYIILDFDGMCSGVVEVWKVVLIMIVNVFVLVGFDFLVLYKLYVDCV